MNIEQCEMDKDRKDFTESGLWMVLHEHVEGKIGSLG